MSLPAAAGQGTLARLCDSVIATLNNWSTTVASSSHSIATRSLTMQPASFVVLVALGCLGELTWSVESRLPWLGPARLAASLPEELHAPPEAAPPEQSEQTFSRADRSLSAEYRQLCETATRKIQFDDDPEYEYQPPHYYEVFCKSHSLLGADSARSNPDKQVDRKCAHPSFHCVQRSRTLFVLRRRWEADCWEPVSRVVASGCDCMWPTSSLGDVSIHY